MRWSAPPLRLFHGTDAVSADIIRSAGIDLRRCKRLADFGPGFYTTTSRAQAERWAETLAETRRSTPAVLEFGADRLAVATLVHLVFPRATPDYLHFVAFNRNRGRPRYGATAQFDVIYGPVSDGRTLDVHPNYDQVGFHTPAALAALGQPLSGDTLKLRPNLRKVVGFT